MKQTKVIGHRGAMGLSPENTLASIEKALSHGVDEIEIDIRITKDNVPVLAHNRMLRDASGALLLISRYPLAELKKRKPDLATLDEAIETINRRAPLIIELKPRESAAPVVTAIKRHLERGWQTTDFLLASFSYATLKTLHKALPDIGLIVNEHWSGIRATGRARRLQTKRLAMSRRFLWSGFIAAISRGGYELYSFTVNDPDKIKKWRHYGLVGVYTDFPDKFVR